MHKVHRLGAYGVYVKDKHLLLTSKKSGVYAGLLDLPGGGIEFSESAEIALQREFREEVGLCISKWQLLSAECANTQYMKEGEPALLHHIGILYRVLEAHVIENTICEDEWDYYPLSIDPTKLTPFAKAALATV